MFIHDLLVVNDKIVLTFSLCVFFFCIELFPIALNVVVKPHFPFIRYSNVSFCSQFFASLLFSYCAPTFHFAFTRCHLFVFKVFSIMTLPCSHLTFIIAILWHCLAYVFGFRVLECWCVSLFIKWSFVQRFCHDIVTPILVCYVCNVSLCISIVYIIELPLLVAMSIFLVCNASSSALPCLQRIHLCTILSPHHFVLFFFTRVHIYILVGTRCIMHLVDPPHPVLNPSVTFNLTFIHPSIHHMSRKSKKGKYNQTSR
jgi:hypothetical protein